MRSKRRFRPGQSGNAAGRPIGARNRATHEAKEFCASVVDDPAYQARLRRRAVTGKLSPAVECLLWHYAKGKPVERQEVGTPGDFSKMSTAETARRTQERGSRL
jgi:hypothetical protein